MEYAFCDQTVTVYRMQGNALTKIVLSGCYLEVGQGRKPENARPQWDFLLIVPGSEQRVFPGDLLVPGIGPEQLGPVDHPLVVGHIKSYYWEGRLAHIEAT